MKDIPWGGNGQMSQSTIRAGSHQGGPALGALGDRSLWGGVGFWGEAPARVQQRFKAVGESGAAAGAGAAPSSFQALAQGWGGRVLA